MSDEKRVFVDIDGLGTWVDANEVIAILPKPETCYGESLVTTSTGVRLSIQCGPTEAFERLSSALGIDVPTEDMNPDAQPELPFAQGNGYAGYTQRDMYEAEKEPLPQQDLTPFEDEIDSWVKVNVSRTFVHDHGFDPTCEEREVDGRLVGDCLYKNPFVLDPHESKEPVFDKDGDVWRWDEAAECWKWEGASGGPIRESSRAAIAASWGPLRDAGLDTPDPLDEDNKAPRLDKDDDLWAWNPNLDQWQLILWHDGETGDGAGIEREGVADINSLWGPVRFATVK